MTNESIKILYVSNSNNFHLTPLLWNIKNCLSFQSALFFIKNNHRKWRYFGIRVDDFEYSGKVPIKNLLKFNNIQFIMDNYVRIEIKTLKYKINILHYF